jgi:hypothetical protein
MNLGTDCTAILTVGVRVQMGTLKNFKFVCYFYTLRYWSPLSHAHMHGKGLNERMQRPLIDPVPGPLIQRPGLSAEKEKNLHSKFLLLQFPRLQSIPVLG